MNNVLQRPCFALGARVSVSAIVICCALSTSKALEIELTFVDGFGQRADAIAAMQRAAEAWERVLSDPIIVRFDVRELPLLELGFTTGATFREPVITEYTAVRQALIADAKSAADDLAVAHLKSGSLLSFRTWTPQGDPVINTGNTAINKFVDVFRGQAKALGLPITGDPLDRDAEIQWNSFFLDNEFDFDRTDGTTGTDFETLAMHEIGHALGFASGVDFVDESSLPGGPLAPEDLDDFAIVRVLDLFRYSAESMPLPDFAPNTSVYFSVDGGVTGLGTFSTGQYNGDGWQAGHWQGESGQGVMDANPVGVFVSPSLVDLLAMDVIGWDLVLPGDFDFDGDVDGADFLHWQRNTNVGKLSDWQSNYGFPPLTAASTPVPEPSTWVLISLAMLEGSISSRRRIAG